MPNPISDFYSKPLQAGNGLSVYSGARRQLGGSFLSGLSRFAVPIMKYLAPKALNFAKNTMDDVIDGKSLKNAAIHQGVNEVRTALKRKRTKRINKRRKRSKTEITSVFNQV